MSISPRLHYPHETKSLPSAYNGAVSTPQRAQAGMRELWKQWEGQVVNGEFPLQRYLGGSEHSAVFLTQHGPGGAERAVIKLILADPKTAEAQVFRWKLATKLPAPGLIRIFHMGQSKVDDTELLYVVMEHADEDLAQILPQRSLTPDEAREMLSPVLDTLAYVHSKGFVHGGLKPSNIMAVADRVKISSDSLCALQEANGCAREVSRYTAPEVGRGAITPAADAWSLGMTIVEVLTQRMPAADPTRPGAVVLPDGLPEPFSGIAKHCLQADPQQRCTIADIGARLKPVPSATGITETIAPARREKQFSAKSLYLMVVAAAGLVALVWMFNGKTQTSNPPDRPAQLEPNQGQPVDSATPARTPSAEGIQESKTSAAAVPSVAPLPSRTASKAEVAPDLGASTVTGREIPGVVHTVMPAVSQRARRTIQGRVKVQVRVQVDSSGNVVSTVLDSPGPSKYFARLAQEASQGWKFAPARADGQDVASQWILHFAFSRSGTEVVPKRARP